MRCDVLMAARGCESAPASRLTALTSRIESRTAGTRCPNTCTSWSARTPRCQLSLGRCTTRHVARSVCPWRYRPTPRSARRRHGCRRCPSRRPSQRRSRMPHITRPRNGRRRRSPWRASGTRPGLAHSRGLGKSRCTTHPRTRSSRRTRLRHTVAHPRFAGTRAPAGAGQRRQANRTESCRHVPGIQDAIVCGPLQRGLRGPGPSGSAGTGSATPFLSSACQDSSPRATIDRLGIPCFMCQDLPFVPRFWMNAPAATTARGRRGKPPMQTDAYANRYLIRADQRGVACSV